ncbi:glycosyltransferase family 2 protein [Burkholderia sp. RS01]|uniref:glycosyltransferase family 2 protein n=1 Tax=unclassified Burkholderia TaxID=2613784 RepID=UPI003218DE38
MDSSKLPVTVLVQTKNEEVGIGHCLRNLTAFSEVIVVDSNSTDGTKGICSGLGVEVVNFTWNGRYPKKKQWQLDNLATKNEWILFLDADETPTPELLESIDSLISSEGASQIAACDIELDYVFAGRPLKYGHRVVKRALLNRNFVRFPEIDDLSAPGMGELEGHYQPEVSGKVHRISGRLLHDDKDPVRTWFDRHNRYSDWEAYLRTQPHTKEATRKKRSLQGRIFDSVPLKPLAFFLYSYILRGGLRDGRAGFDYAVALSTYYWQIGLKVRELQAVGPAGVHR